MNVEQYKKKYSPLISPWVIDKEIGSGSFGKVFEIKREELGTIYKAALKIITIPQNEEQRQSVIQSLGLTEENATSYFREMVNDLTKEITLMAELQGNTNIVSYADHRIIKYKDKLQWDILIRMELLTPFKEYAKLRKITEEDVIKLGKDICNALIICERKNIVHRDIKPENIFISDTGSFKLGDFGVARIIEKTTGASTKVGTYDYMAPEVFRGDNYDNTADIYSLGLVLYRLLNGDRLPFLPPAPERITYTELKEATSMRMRGIEFPTPAFASNQMASIILKACKYDSSERYLTPEEMLRDLNGINFDNKKELEEEDKKSSNNSNSKTRGIKSAICICALLLICIACFMFYYRNNDEYGTDVSMERADSDKGEIKVVNLPDVNATSSEIEEGEEAKAKFIESEKQNSNEKDKTYKSVEVSNEDYDIVGIDEEYWEEENIENKVFYSDTPSGDPAIDKYLSLPNETFESATDYMLFEGTNNLESDTLNLIRFASFSTEQLYVYGTYGFEDYRVILIKTQKERICIVTDWSYRLPAIQYTDFDSDGEKELIIACMSVHGPGCYRDELYFIKADGNGKYDVKTIDRALIVERLKETIYIDENKHSLVHKKQNDEEDTISLNEFENIINDRGNDSDVENYMVEALDFVNYWKYSFINNEIHLNVGVSIYFKDFGGIILQGENGLDNFEYMIVCNNNGIDIISI